MTAAKFTPLMSACREGNLADVKSNLIQAKEVDEDDQFTALTYASFFNDDPSISIQIIKLLLGAGEDPNHYDRNGYTALTWAAQNGHVEACRALVDGGAGINPQSKEGLTPLLVAVAQGHREVIKYLLYEANADQNLRTNKHVTPLISAVSGGDKNLDIVQYLLENDARVSDFTLDLKISPIHIAAQEGHVKILSALLRSSGAGLEVDMKNRMGATPLMMAATKGSYDVTKMLLEAGADPTASIVLNHDEGKEKSEGETIEQVTPLTMATSGGFEEIVELLERYVDL